MARTIQSPGVEVSEVDLTQRAAVGGGTSVLVPGFAQHGPADEVFAVTSLTEFERIYGAPTNAAERYFFQSAKSVFNSNARVLATRVPYGSGGGLGYADNVYTALFYPVFPVHRGSICKHPAGTTATSKSESAGGALATSCSAVSAAFSTATYDGQTGSGVSLSGDGDVAGDLRLDFDTNLRINEGLSAGYIFGKPQMVRLSKGQYQDLREGNFEWKDLVRCDLTFSTASNTWGEAGMIVTNVSKAIINDRYEGFYLGLTDNSQFNPATDFDSIREMYTVSETSTDLSLDVPKVRRNFPLSGTATSNDESVSEVLENLPQWDMTRNSEFNDAIVLGLFKMRASVFSTDTLKLDFGLSEGYIGSLDANRRLQNPAGGSPETFFLGDVEDGSGRIEILVNPHISLDRGSWTNPNGTRPAKFSRMLTKRSIVDSCQRSLSGNFGAVESSVLSSLTANGFNLADSLVPLGDYVEQDPRTKEIGNVPTKLDRIFRSIENLDLVNVDLSIEAGLGSIYAGAQYNQLAMSNDPLNRDVFDDQAIIKIGQSDDGTGSATGMYQLKEGAITADVTSGAAGLQNAAYSVIQNYRSVAQSFLDFAEFNRKDHLFIADPLRNILVQGENGKVMTFDKSRTFTQFVYWPMRHLFGSYNSSYMATFGNWGRMYDGASDKLHWCPFSGTAAATMANSDAVFGPWHAAAGFTRGRFGGVTDIAVVPSQKHRDQLYKINVNPVTSFPGEGFVIFGQKTMFKKPSAFDRINVRRLFLYLEKLVRNTMKYYVFEPNTLLTRTSVLNNLTPVFDNIRNQQGVFDYLIICDGRNNGPAVIDQNELVVDIYVKPVRTAEIILVNFFATRTGQDFNEIIS